jgi:hypothetical protein
VQETVRQLAARFRITKDQAHANARGAIPDGMLDGGNVRAALHDAEALVAVLAIKSAAAADCTPSLTSGLSRKATRAGSGERIERNARGRNY